MFKLNVDNLFEIASTVSSDLQEFLPNVCEDSGRWENSDAPVIYGMHVEKYMHKWYEDSFKGAM